MTTSVRMERERMSIGMEVDRVVTMATAFGIQHLNVRALKPDSIGFIVVVSPF